MKPDPRGKRAEAKTLKRLGVRPTKASGALAEKGDGRLGRLLVEIKATEKGSRSLKLAELQKAAREARQAGCRPVFCLVFVDGDGNPRTDGAWVLMPEQHVDLREEAHDELGD